MKRIWHRRLWMESWRRRGLDVLAQEPMSEDNPLRAIKDSNKLIITPHIAWASVEARTNLMHIIYSQIEDFFAN